MFSVPFHPPPTLPPRFAPLLPYRRGLYELERGGQAGLELHYVDHGPTDAPAVVLLHGNPTWSFGWRKVIAALGTYRCIAPDLLGFGLSGRLATTEAHTLDRHADSVAELLKALGLSEVVLVGQDWGGPIAAAVGRRFPGRVRALVLSNTNVIQPQHGDTRRPWLERLARTPGLGDLAFHRLGLPSAMLWSIQRSRSGPQGAIAAAYRWPLRNPDDRIGMLALARWTPTDTQHSGYATWQATETWVRDFEGPITLVWGRNDPQTPTQLPIHKAALPHAHVTLCDAGHWIQEDAAEVFATAIRDTDRHAAPEHRRA